LHDHLGLLHRREREAIAAFYAMRDFAPLWWNDGRPNPETAPVILRLQHAADDGLDVKGVPRLSSSATNEEIAAADLALTDAVVAYGRQASGVRVDPQLISRLIGEEPEPLFWRLSRRPASGPATNCKNSIPSKGVHGTARKTARIAPWTHRWLE
jgi:hypothetical protein